MAILYYGGKGSCTIEGVDIRGVEISYRGAVKITKTCGNNFHIGVGKNKIMVFPIGEGVLSDLFTYKGEIKITSVLVADSNAEKVPTTIKRVMDYAELMETNAEDLAVKSERLNEGHIYRNKVKETTVESKTIDNLNTRDGDYYKKDGSRYEGAYHIHISSARAMTGAEHTDKSEVLFIKSINDGEIIETGKLKYV